LEKVEAENLEKPTLGLPSDFFFTYNLEQRKMITKKAQRKKKRYKKFKINAYIMTQRSYELLLQHLKPRTLVKKKNK